MFAGTIRATAWVAALAAIPVCAQAQTYPSRPIHIIHGFPAGGGADILARHFVRRLEKVSDKTFVLDNKPGNAGNLAISLAAKAKPDGYTLVIGSSGNMVGARYFYKDVLFDPVRDFIPIGIFTEGGFVLLTGNNTPATNVAELTAFLKPRPQNKFAYSNQLGLLASEYYKVRARIEAAPIAYKSAPEAYPDVQSGMVEFMVADATTSSALIKAGKLRPLAMASMKRFPVFPDLPTMREQGFEGADFSTWWALYAPAGTPQPIIAQLGLWLREACEDDELQKTLETIGNIVLIDDGAATLDRLKREIARWEPLVKAAGITPQ